MSPASAPASSVAPPTATRARLETVDGLRAVAALAVAWFHFTNANAVFPTRAWLRASGAYGWMGVEIFFVISGFIIPYAMRGAGYRLADWPTFLGKRLLRLHPSYLAAIVITLGLWWVSSRAPGFTRPPPTTTQILLHVAYLPALFRYPWLDTSYWTLAIEFQYYLLIAVAFVWLAHPSARLRGACFAAACVLPFVVPTDVLVFHYVALFALGAATFWQHAGLVSTRGYLVSLAAAGAATAATSGAGVAAVGVGTALLIAYGGRVRPRPLAWLGTISYSLYLLHGPIGERVVNLGARYARTPAAEVLVMFGALGASIVAASVLYWVIEGPACRASSRLRYARARGSRMPVTDRKTGANSRS